MHAVAVAIALLLTMGGCGREPLVTATTTPPLDAARLDLEVGDIARRLAPGVLGAAVMNLESGEVWSLNGARSFPMQSVFKAPLAAAVLAEVDAGRLSLDEMLILKDSDISPPFSPIGAAYPARARYTVGELLVLAAGESDNTAADVLMARIGGPGAVTAWLRSKRVEGVRIDRYERQLQPQSLGLASFRPAWKDEADFSTVLNTLPAQTRIAAVTAYLADPQDTATPVGMLSFLSKLKSGDLLSRDSTARLLRIMTQTPTGPKRLRAGLPQGAALAHKTGSARTLDGMTPAFNDVGIVTLSDGRSYGVVAFVSGARLPGDEREKAIADLMRTFVRSIG